jgi:hypothetical protein
VSSDNCGILAAFLVFCRQLHIQYLKQITGQYFFLIEQFPAANVPHMACGGFRSAFPSTESELGYKAKALRLAFYPPLAICIVSKCSFNL